MLREFFYSITTLFIWVSITCEVWGVDTLKNWGRCSISALEKNIPIGVDTLKKIKVDAAKKVAIAETE